MVTGELRRQVDKVWDAFWSGGIANPVEVIEQITYLLFIKRLDDLQLLAEKKAARFGEEVESPVFPDGYDSDAPKRRPYRDLRWSVFTNFSPSEMFEVVSEHVFPWLRRLGAEGSSYARNMRDARFTIPTPALLTRVVDLLAEIPMEDRDTKGDIYEYMLAKLATSGTNGQFRTARHIIQLMVDLQQPRPDDRIIDPAFMRKSDVSRDIQAPVRLVLGGSSRSLCSPVRTRATTLRRQPAQSLPACARLRQPEGP